MKRLVPAILVCSTFAFGVGLNTTLAQSGTTVEGAQSGGPVWVRAGPIVRLLPPPQTPVDEERVRAARGSGCGTSAIRFGDTAAMRGTGASVAWATESRRLASAAFISDVYASADAFLEAASSAVGGADGEAALLAHRVLVALQFGRTAEARALLDLIDIDILSDPVASDVVFLDVVARSESANAETWRDDLMPRLDLAMRLDPTSFQVRAWRVLAWLEAVGATESLASNRSCPALARDFSDRLLDLSDAGACPAMIGHLDFAIARHFRARTSLEPVAPGDGGVRMVWRQFASGLMAEIAGADRTANAMRAALGGAAGPGGACADLLAAELQRIGGTQ